MCKMYGDACRSHAKKHSVFAQADMPGTENRVPCSAGAAVYSFPLRERSAHPALFRPDKARLHFLHGVIRIAVHHHRTDLPGSLLVEIGGILRADQLVHGVLLYRNRLVAAIRRHPVVFIILPGQVADARRLRPQVSPGL